MSLIHLLQRFAILASAREAAAVVILATALGTAVYAHLCAPAKLKQHRLALGVVALGALALLVGPHGWLPVPVMVSMVIAILTGFSLHTLTEARCGSDLPSVEPPSRRWTTIWIASASILAALFLLTDLGGYAGTLMVWEPEAMTGLIEASRIGTGLSRFAAQRLLWDDGVISSSHHSLLYGSGTLALWRLFGVSPTTLRLMSVVLAAACLPAAYLLGKRIGGRRAAVAALVVISLSPPLLFYGRYGISIAGSLFCVLVVLLVCERMVDPNSISWWLGLAAAAAAYLATLGYSPARVVTVALVLVTLLVGLWTWRQQPRSRKAAFALMVALLIGVWLVQASFNTSRSFVAARGEQVFTIHHKPEMVKQLLDEQVDPEQLTPHQRLRLTRTLMARRLPELKSALSFCIRPIDSAWHVLRRDPPDLPLIQGPLLLFAIWGCVYSLALWRRRWPIVMMAAFAAACLPILLTSRADIHRLILASLPVVVWSALGIVAANRVARECGVNSATRNAVGAVLVILIAASNSTFLFYPQPQPRSPMATDVCSEIDSIPQPVAVGLVSDPGSEGEIQLALCNRQHRHRALHWELLSRETVDALTGKKGAPETAIELIETIRHRSTVILAPRGPFAGAARVLTERGVRIRSFGSMKAGWLRIDRVASSFFISNGSPANSMSGETRTPKASEHAERSAIPLGFDQLRDVQYGFKAPRFDVAYDGKPITIGGTTYGTGIGMHAWTHMWFEVPQGAVALEATIGLSDAVTACDQALVTFEVWNDEGRRIYDSGPVHGGTLPQRIHVPLDATPTIELVLTEGGNRRDCDHGNWGDAIFTLGP